MDCAVRGLLCLKLLPNESKRALQGWSSHREVVYDFGPVTSIPQQSWATRSAICFVQLALFWPRWVHITSPLRQYEVRFHVGYYRISIYIHDCVCVCAPVVSKPMAWGPIISTDESSSWFAKDKILLILTYFDVQFLAEGLAQGFCPASRVQYYNNLQYIGDVGKCVPRFTEHSVSVRTVKWPDFPMLHIWIQLYRWKLRGCPNSSILEQLWLITSVLAINNQQQLGMLHTPFRDSFDGRGFWRLVQVVNNFRRFD